MDFGSRIDDLLKQCAEGSLILQDQKSTLSSSPAVHQLISQDLQLGMQRLIRLRNVFDENAEAAQDEMWAENTMMVLDQVRAQLHHALQVGCNSSTQGQRTDVVPLLTRSNSNSSNSSSSGASSSSSSSLSTSPDDLALTTDARISNQGILFHATYREENASDYHQLPVTRRLRIPFRSKAAFSIESLRNGNDLLPHIIDDDGGCANFASDAIVDQPLRIGFGYGSYVCYSCTVLSDKAPAISIRKRYSDFVDLRQRLLKHYPHLKKSIPKLPPKGIVGKFTPAFVERRRRDLEYFFKYIVLHPTLGSSSLVMHWIAP